MSVYVGYTPWKKLKKLYHISRGIIHTYGLRYFFYVVNLELRKNGLSMFSVDEKPISPFENISFKKQYRNYLKYINEKLTKETSDKSSKMSYMPLISIILIIDDKNLDDIKNTIDSIKNQTYANWEITIYSKNSSKVKELIDKDNPKILFCEKLSDDSFKNILNLHGDFMGFLHSGIILSKFD